MVRKLLHSIKDSIIRIGKTHYPQNKIFTKKTLHILACIAVFCELLADIAIKGIVLESALYGVDLVKLEYMYIILKHIGWGGIILCCYMVVDGIKRTSNKSLYLLRLFMFALLAEIPYDLTAYSHLSMESCNAFFSIWCVAASCSIYDVLQKKKREYAWIPTYFCITVILIAGSLLKCDYIEIILTSGVIYMLTEQYRILGCLLSGMLFSIYSMPGALLASVLILITNFEYKLPEKYNTKPRKYIRYAVYPALSLILYMIFFLF